MIKDRTIIWIMCFLFLIMGFIIFFSSKEANECMGNPLTYGADKITDEVNGGVSCICSFGSPNYANFYFDEEVVETIRG